MAISEAFANTQAVSTTEWSCPRDAAYDVGQPQTDDGVYQVFLELNGMVATNILRIRVYEKVMSSSTQRIVCECILRDAQVEPVWVSPSLVLMHGWDVTLYGVSGTITVNWSIRRIS